jgi:hypothetical protein
MYCNVTVGCSAMSSQVPCKSKGQYRFSLLLFTGCSCGSKSGWGWASSLMWCYWFFHGWRHLREGCWSLCGACDLLHTGVHLLWLDKTKTSHTYFPPVLRSDRPPPSLLPLTTHIATHTHTHTRRATSLSLRSQLPVLSEFQQNLLHLSEIGKRIFCSPKRPDRVWGPDSLLHSEYRTPCFYR